jgi:hypothetical protein
MVEEGGRRLRCFWFFAMVQEWSGCWWFLKDLCCERYCFKSGRCKSESDRQGNTVIATKKSRFRIDLPIMELCIPHQSLQGYFTFDGPTHLLLISLLLHFAPHWILAGRAPNLTLYFTLAKLQTSHFASHYGRWCAHTDWAPNPHCTDWIYNLVGCGDRRCGLCACRVWILVATWGILLRCEFSSRGVTVAANSTINQRITQQ